LVSKVYKWGDSHGLRPSKQVLNLAVGVDVQITPDKAGSKYNLAELVARIPKAFEGKEEGFGPPLGKEQW
jgi:antitoxin component of MazEF toxin-antitoxin module